MPKQKTHKGVQRRFKITKNNIVLARKSHRNRNLAKKRGSRKRTFGVFKNIDNKIGKKIAKGIKDAR